MNLSRLLGKAEEYADELSVWRMSLLMKLGRQTLPAGYWGDKHQPLPPDKVYLTFDDGPSPDTTPYLLELLEEQQAKATFFLIGTEVERYPDLVEQIYRAGHTIGNHSYSHKFFPVLTGKKLESEIDRANQLIEDITGGTPTLFRPPFGIMDQRAASYLNERKMSTIYWSSAPEDWNIPGTERVVRRVLKELGAGSLIVLHEGKNLAEQTLPAAKEIIYRCLTDRYHLSRIEADA